MSVACSVGRRQVPYLSSAGLQPAPSAPLPPPSSPPPPVPSPLPRAGRCICMHGAAQSRKSREIIHKRGSPPFPLLREVRRTPSVLKRSCPRGPPQLRRRELIITFSPLPQSETPHPPTQPSVELCRRRSPSCSCSHEPLYGGHDSTRSTSCCCCCCPCCLCRGTFGSRREFNGASSMDVEIGYVRA